MIVMALALNDITDREACLNEMIPNLKDLKSIRHFTPLLVVVLTADNGMRSLTLALADLTGSDGASESWSPQQDISVQKRLLITRTIIMYIYLEW